MNRLDLRSSLLFVAAGLVGATASYTTGASAWEVRKHSSACFSESGYWSGRGILVAPSNSTSNLYCPAEDTSAMPKGNTRIYNVHGYDNVNGVVNTEACRISPNGGASCQTGPHSGVSMVTATSYQITVPTSTVWTPSTFADFGYVHLTLPADTGLYGTYQSN
jgi:hypothetical protein